MYFIQSKGPCTLLRFSDFWSFPEKTRCLQGFQMYLASTDHQAFELKCVGLYGLTSVITFVLMEPTSDVSS